MLSISHAAAGALIASAIPNPYISIPVALASHYILDGVAHWDVGTGMGKGIKQPKVALVQEIPDLILAGLFILVAFAGKIDYSSPLTFILSAPVYGGFFGLVPDFLEAPRNFLKWEPWFLRPINKFHGSFHHSIPHVAAGLAPQALLLITVWLLR